MKNDHRSTISVSAGPSYGWYQYLQFDEKGIIDGRGFFDTIIEPSEQGSRYHKSENSTVLSHECTYFENKIMSHQI